MPDPTSTVRNRAVASVSGETHGEIPASYDPETTQMSTQRKSQTTVRAQVQSASTADGFIAAIVNHRNFDTEADPPRV